MALIPITGTALHALVDEGDLPLASGTWRISTGGYATAMRGPRTNHRRVYLHRLIAGLPHGDPRTVDHINRNRLDNRRANLRVVTPAENYQNVGSRGGTSRFRGVSWSTSKGKWVAYAKLNQRSHHLGCFEDEAEAASAAAEFRQRHMPFATT